MNIYNKITREEWKDGCEDVDWIDAETIKMLIEYTSKNKSEWANKRLCLRNTPKTPNQFVRSRWSYHVSRRTTAAFTFSGEQVWEHIIAWRKHGGVNISYVTGWYMAGDSCIFKLCEDASTDPYAIYISAVDEVTARELGAVDLWYALKFAPRELLNYLD